MDISVIKEKINSNDVNVLKQSLEYVNQRLTLERSRSDRAETRSSSLLSVSGILSGLVVFFMDSFFDGKIAQNDWGTIYFLSSVFMLSKSLYYSVRSLWVYKSYELMIDSSFDFQSLNEIESIREEIAGKIWEYYQLLPISNKRLFFLNRSQRNLVGALMILLFLTIYSMYVSDLEIGINIYLTKSFGVVFIAMVLFLDLISEKYGNLWTSK